MREVKEYDDRIVFINYAIKNNKKTMVSRQTVMKEQPVPLYAPNCKCKPVVFAQSPVVRYFYLTTKTSRTSFSPQAMGATILL